MPKQTPHTRRRTAPATAEDVRRILGARDEETILQILALRPSVADVEKAAMWATGDGEALGGVKAAAGVAAEILEILAVEEEEEPIARGRS